MLMCVATRASRRVTVVFRGSVNLNDWITNLTLKPKQLEIPKVLRDQDLGLDAEPIAAHAGFCGECFVRRVMHAMFDGSKKLRNLKSTLIKALGTSWTT